MPFGRRKRKAAATEVPVDYLLISTPNLLASHRIRTQLAAADITTGESEMGLEVYCGHLDWHLMLESLALMLSPLERQDTRVAIVSDSQDPANLHRAIFRAKSLERLLEEMRQSWFNRVLEERQIAIHFQPLIQFPPGRVHGYECLMRGMDAEGKLISPGRMFEAAQTLGKQPMLDECCRAAALKQVARLARQDLTFFINFLPSALTGVDEYVASARRELKAAGLEPEQIAFEVVETDRMLDQQHLSHILRSFRKAGFRVVLDDVGAGYSSLLNLANLRPDYIKLDGELVRRGARSALEAKMIADLADTARQNGIIVVAEGIENEEELRLILDSGIRITQGYFHTRPQPCLLSEAAVRGIIRRIQAVAANRRIEHPN